MLPGDLRAFAAKAAGDPGDDRSALRRLLTAGIGLVVLVVATSGFVAAAGAVQVDPPEWPPFYAQIAHDPPTYALLELPLFTEQGRGEDHYQMYQVIHQKPRFGGRWSRDHKLTNPADFPPHASLFQELLLLDGPVDNLRNRYPAQDFLQRTDYGTQGLAILNYYRVGYIVLYKDAIATGWDAARFATILQQIFGPNVQPYYEDSLMRVYKVPLGPPAVNPITLDTGSGWYQPGVGENNVVYRWANSADGPASELYTMNLTQTPLPATLGFTIYTYQQPREVTVTLDGAPLRTIPLTPAAGYTPVAIDLTLPPGRHTIAFSSPEPALPVDQPHDSRRLSFGMFGVSLNAR